MTTWNSRPDTDKSSAYRRASSGPSEIDEHRCAAIRTPNEISRLNKPLQGIVSKIVEYSTGRHLIHRWNETSNPFLDDIVQMAGVRGQDRQRLEDTLDALEYEWVFINRAQFRFHPYGCEGQYVIIPDYWDGDWPQTDR